MKKVTIVIPTYNEEKNITNCLKSIFFQDYPRKFLQVIVADGGSTDKTVEIAKALGAEVLSKPDLTSEETRKPYAIRNIAKGEIIGLLDADNRIPLKKNWLRKMINPFDDPEISSTDTLYYTFRKKDNLITKYNALIGGDDPIASYLGINDRFCYFTNKWTGMPHKEEEKGDYIKVTFQKNKVPASGSNGFFFRKFLFNKVPNEPFIHPLFVYDLVNIGYNKMAKVKEGLIHVQDGSLKTFFKKKIRRVKRRQKNPAENKDKRFGGDKVDWKYNYDLNKTELIKRSLYMASVIFPVKDALIGFTKKPTKAWVYHPIATTVLLFIYAYYSLSGAKPYN